MLTEEMLMRPLDKNYNPFSPKYATEPIDYKESQAEVELYEQFKRDANNAKRRLNRRLKKYANKI